MKGHKFCVSYDLSSNCVNGVFTPFIRDNFLGWVGEDELIFPMWAWHISAVMFFFSNLQELSTPKKNEFWIKTIMVRSLGKKYI